MISSKTFHTGRRQYLFFLSGLIGGFQLLKLAHVSIILPALQGRLFHPPLVALRVLICSSSLANCFCNLCRSFSVPCFRQLWGPAFAAACTGSGLGSVFFAASAFSFPLSPSIGPLIITAFKHFYFMVVDFPDRVCQFRNKIPVVAYKNQRAFIFFSASTSNSTLCMSRWLVGSSSIRKLALLVITFCECHPGFFPTTQYRYFFYIISAEKTPSKDRSSALSYRCRKVFISSSTLLLMSRASELVLGVEALFHIVSPDPLSLEGPHARRSYAAG